MTTSFRRRVTVAAVAVLAVERMPTSEGFASFVAKLPNGGGFPDAPAIGHPDAAGTQGLNEFGKDWNKYGKGWTKAYCMADSDGDGFTNGQELGDPCCTWTPTNPGSLIKEGISHPSDKTKTPTNPKLKEKCSTGGGGGGGGGGATGGGGGAGKNGTDSGNDGPGTVGPAEPPADDDEDDSSESAVLSTSAATSASPNVAIVVSSIAACILQAMLS